MVYKLKDAKGKKGTQIGKIQSKDGKKKIAYKFQILSPDLVENHLTDVVSVQWRWQRHFRAFVAPTHQEAGLFWRQGEKKSVTKAVISDRKWLKVFECESKIEKIRKSSKKKKLQKNRKSKKRGAISQLRSGTQLTIALSAVQALHTFSHSWTFCW